MFPLFAVLLLAAWLFHPWSYADIPFEDAHAASGATAVAGVSVPPMPVPAMERQFVKELRDGDLPPLQAPAPSAAPAPTLAPTPAPTRPPPAPAPSPTVVMPADGLEALICSFAWPCQEALAVARCESGVDKAGNLDGAFAQSRSSYGLFQINAVHARRWSDFWDSWMDPTKNTQWAFQLWSEQGWRPWNCRP